MPDCDKTCINCIYYLSFRDDYDDEDEPWESGWCREPERYKNDDTMHTHSDETCESFISKQINGTTHK